MHFANLDSDETRARAAAFCLSCAGCDIDLLLYFRKVSGRKALEQHALDQKGIYFLLAKDGREPMHDVEWDFFWSRMRDALEKEQENVGKQLQISAMQQLFLGRIVRVSITENVSSIEARCHGIHETRDGTVQIILSGNNRYGFIPLQQDGDKFVGPIDKNHSAFREVSLAY